MQNFPSNSPESSLKMYLNIIVEICLAINQRHSALINVLCAPDTFSNSTNCVHCAYE